MLRTAAIASVGLRRLLVPSTTAMAPGSRTPLLLRFISGPATSSEPALRRFLPTLDLTRGYARGRQSSSGDSESDINDDDDSRTLTFIKRNDFSDEEMDSGNECDDDKIFFFESLTEEDLLDSDCEDDD